MCDAEMIELVLLHRHGILDVPEAIFTAGLGVEKRGELSPRAEGFDVSVCFVVFSQFFELMSGNMGEQLI